MFTRERFRAWALLMNGIFERQGPVSRNEREWADAIRPYDPKLADLYLEMARVNEAIRAHLAERVGAKS
jgi:hypothetical protein